MLSVSQVNNVDFLNSVSIWGKSTQHPCLASGLRIYLVEKFYCKPRWKNINITLCPIKHYNENYHGVWQHPGINWSCPLLFLSSKHTLVLSLISYSLYWSHVLLLQLCLSSYWSQFLEDSVVDCLEFSVPHLCLLLCRSVNALRMPVTVQVRLNMWKMSQLRENWDEARKSNILRKLRCLKVMQYIASFHWYITY